MDFVRILYVDDFRHMEYLIKKDFNTLLKFNPSIKLAIFCHGYDRPLNSSSFIHNIDL